MSQTIGTVLIDIQANTQKLVQGFTRAEGQVNSSIKGMKKNIFQLTTAYLSLQGAADLSRKFIANADAMNLVASRLKIVTKDSEELLKTQKELYDISQNARVAYLDTADLYAKMARSTQQFGIEQSKLTKVTDSISKAITISGESAQSTVASLRQLGQAFSGNFQTVGQELQSVREQAPRVYQMMVEGMGVTRDEFKKMAEDGELSTEKIIDALIKGSKSVDEEFLKVTKTVGQASEQVTNAMQKIVFEIDNTYKITQTISDGFTDLSKAIEGIDAEDINRYLELSKNVGYLATAIIGAKVATLTYNKVAKIAIATNAILGGSFGGVNRAILITAASTRALTLAMRTIPLVAIAAGISAVAQSFSEADKKAKAFAGTLDKITAKQRLEEVKKELAEIDEKIKNMTLEQKIGLGYQSAYNDLWKEKEALEKILETKKEINQETKKQNEDLKTYNDDEWKKYIKNLTESDRLILKRTETLKKANDEWEKERAELDKLAEESIKKYNEEALKTYNNYVQITGSDYDKWLLNVNNQMVALAESGSLTAEELQKVYDTLEGKRDLEIGIKGIDESMDSMTKMLDAQIELAESGMDWGNSLDGVAKSISNIAKATKKINLSDLKFDKQDIELQKDYAKEFLKANGDIVKEKEAEKKFDDDYTKLKTTQKEAEIAGYAELAGAMSSAFKQGSDGAIAFAAVQSALGIASSWTAIAEAWALGFPQNIPAVAMVTSAVMPIIQQLGGSGSGGGGSTASPYSASELANSKITELTDETVVDRLDQQIELLKAIEKNGSAQALSVDLARAEFNQSLNEWVQDVFDMSRMGYVQSNLNTQDEANISNYYASKGLINPYTFGNGTIAINSSLLRSNPEELIKIMADMSEMVRGDGFSYTGTFGQKLAEELGWGAEAHEAFLAQIKSTFTELQGYLNDWAISVVDSVSEIRSSAEDMKGFYDDITGKDFYATQKLTQAFSDFDALLSNGQTYADYLVQNINAIEDSTKFIYELSGVLDENGQELTNYELLLSKNGDLIEEQIAKVDEFGSVVGTVFDGGVEEALNYIDSIELVSDTLATSRENIKDFEDSFKTDSELLQDMADNIGVNLAMNMEELDSLFNNLKDGLGGLTDAELELLQANKEIIDAISEMSRDAFDSIFDSISPANNTSFKKAQADLLLIVNSAKNGILPSSDKLSSVIDSVTSNDVSNYSSMSEFLREQKISANAFKELEDMTSVSTSIDNQMLNELQYQTEALTNIQNNTLSLAPTNISLPQLDNTNQISYNYTNDMVTEIKNLRGDLDMLRAETRSILDNAYKSRRILENVTQNRTSVSIEAVS